MSSSQPVLDYGRVRLRPWSVNDAEQVYAACQDPAIQRWTPVPSPYRYEDAVSYVSEIAPAAWRDGGAVFAVIAVDAPERVAGAIGAHGFTDEIAHIGYWTAPSARRQGLTTAALRAVTKYFLGERAAARVELVVEPANIASMRVAERAGFTAEGILRQRILLHGRRGDVAMYSMLPNDPSARRL